MELYTTFKRTCAEDKVFKEEDFKIFLNKLAKLYYDTGLAMPTIYLDEIPDFSFITSFTFTIKQDDENIEIKNHMYESDIGTFLIKKKDSTCYCHGCINSKVK